MIVIPGFTHWPSRDKDLVLVCYGIICTENSEKILSKNARFFFILFVEVFTEKLS